MRRTPFLSLVLALGCGVSARQANYGSPVARSQVSPASTSSDYGDDAGEGAQSTEEVRVVAAAEAEPAGLFAFAADAVEGPAPTAAPSSAVAAVPEALVVEGWITLQTDDIVKTTEAIHQQIAAVGGRVVSEQISSRGSAYASMELRLPPDAVKGFDSWLGEHGRILDKRFSGTDVSRTLFEQQIALDNLTLTLDRLRKLLDRGDLKMADVLAIEKEMNRVRGRIEQIKGENRFLKDRVAMATLTLTLQSRRSVVFAPDAKVHPGGRASALILPSPNGREQVRFGGGATLLFDRAFSLDLDVFSGPGDESAALVTTVGGAMYSEFLGNGDRAFLNPFLGFRVGYGRFDRASHFVAAAELGVELFKHEYLLVDVSARALGLVGSSSHFAVQTTFGVTVPF